MSLNRWAIHKLNGKRRNPNQLNKQVNHYELTTPLIKVSVSKQSFKIKPDQSKIKELKFERKSITLEEFKRLIQEGYCFCHWFRTKNSIFSTKEKINNNFVGANLIFVDVDECQTEMNAFLSKLSTKPTLYYTTPSNMEEGKGYRFRLCYLFIEDILNCKELEALYDAIIRSIQADIPSFKDKDPCGKQPSRYFNGNGKNCELHTTDNVFCFNDFGIDRILIEESYYVGILNPGSIEPKLKENEVLSDTQFKFKDEEFKNDFFTLSPYDLIEKYKDKYEYFVSTELHFNDEGYAIIDDNYNEIRRKYYIDSYQDENGKEHKCPVPKKLKDGDQRRKKLFLSGLIRKSIKPDIGLEQLLFNFIYDRTYYFDNSDKVLTNKRLLEIAKDVIKLPPESIKLNNKWKKPKYKIDKEYCRSHNKSPKTLSNEVRSLIKDREIGELYDINLSVKENLQIIKNAGLKVCLSRLYQFCKKHNLPTSPNRKNVRKVSE